MAASAPEQLRHSDARYRVEGAGGVPRRRSESRGSPRLVNLTQMQRLDDPATYNITPEARPVGFPNDSECRSWDPSSDLSHCMTRMMDCRKPSGAWTTNVRPHLMAPGKKILQICASDGPPWASQEAPGLHPSTESPAVRDDFTRVDRSRILAFESRFAFDSHDADREVVQLSWRCPPPPPQVSRRLSAVYVAHGKSPPVHEVARFGAVVLHTWASHQNYLSLSSSTPLTQQLPSRQALDPQRLR